MEAAIFVVTVSDIVKTVLFIILIGFFIWAFTGKK